VTPRQTVLAFAVLATATLAGAQARPATGLTRDEIAALARVEVAISHIRDSLDVQLALPRNKKDEVQTQLREKMRSDVAAAIKASGMTDADYRRKTFIISTDNAARHIFDSVVVAVTGAPLPGIYVAPASAPTVAVPPGPVGNHIGHVVNSFNGTPMNQGLLPTALGEARVAQQHAALAARQPTNLEYMKTHAGHVINAIDPTVVATGPGLGYGLRRAALAVAEHIGMAAAAEGATAAQKLHAGHVANCANNTAKRAEDLLALAQRVLTATDAAAAAQLINQVASLADQLIAGADGNSDGRITVDVGEGGLQLADDHVKLMLGGVVR
jgi:hypothetical protein